VEIRQAEIDDVAGIAPLFDAYRMFYQQASDLKLATHFLTERIQQGESVIFIAQDDNGDYLGFVQLYPTFSSVSAQRLWILNDLYIVPNARGHKVATGLLNQARAYAIQTRAKGITLSTARINLPAQRLYESFGYIKDADYFDYFLPTQGLSN